jgi:hypothetical protein
MRVGDITCETVGALMTRWYDQALTDIESDGYEQHLLLCPPCLVQAAKLRTALGALRALGSAPSPGAATADLVRGLAAVVGGSVVGGSVAGDSVACDSAGAGTGGATGDEATGGGVA